MFNKLEPIIESVVTLLTAEMPTFNIHRDELLKIEEDTLPAIVVYPIIEKIVNPEEVDFENGHERVIQLRCEVRTTGSPISSVVSPIADEIARVLITSSELDSKVNRIVYTSVTFDGALGENDTFAAGAVDFEVYYNYSL